MSTHQGFFNAKRLGNHVHCTFFFVLFYLTHIPIKYNDFQADLFDPKRVLTHWVRVGKGYLTLTKFPKLEPCHQMQFKVISRSTLWGGVLLLFKAYRKRIVSPTNRARDIWSSPLFSLISSSL